MNRYMELKQRQQAESDAFPMQFAFSHRQFAEGMAALGCAAAEVLGNPRLKRGSEKAVTEICARDGYI